MSTFKHLYIYIYYSDISNFSTLIFVIKLLTLHLPSKQLGVVDLRKILKRCTTPSCFDGRCNLCLEEKIQIMSYIVNLLNQRWDLIARCRHRNKPDR